MYRQQTMRESKNCVICGRIYLPNTASQLYCSKRCANIASSRREREKTKSWWLDSKCAVCGKETDGTFYCSEECQKKDKTSTRQKAIGYNPENGYPCDNCSQKETCSGSCVKWEIWFPYTWDKTCDDILRKLNLTER